MADVDDRGSAIGGADRGQLLLVGALALAVMLVVLAVLLNAAIYTGNVATRDAGPETGEAIEYENEATAMVHATLGAVNEEEHATYATLRQNFTSAVDDWSATARIHSASALSDTSIVLPSDPTEGTAIRQSSERNFTDASESANWTVANETDVRALRMNVSQGSLATEEDIVDDVLTDDSPSYFTAVFEDGSTQYRVQLRGTDDGDAIVRVLDENGDQVDDDCTVMPDDGRVRVDLTGAEAGSEHCRALETVFDDLDGPYTISYRNSENAEGTYSMVVDRRIDRLETGADTNSESQPSASRALFSAEIELTYRTTDVYYQTEFEVAPGETDD